MYSLILACFDASRDYFNCLCFCQLKKVIVLASEPFALMPQTENERYYLDPATGSKRKFPSILSAPSVYLSLVVPSYNEEKRRNYIYIDIINDSLPFILRQMNK